MIVTLRSEECYDQIWLNSKTLEFKNQCEFIGIIIDTELKFNSHSDYIASENSKSIRSDINYETENIFFY